MPSRTLRDQISKWLHLDINLHRKDVVLVGGAVSFMLVLSAVGWLVGGALALVVALSFAFGLIVLLHFETYRRSEKLHQEVRQIFKQTEGLLSILSCLKINRPLPPLGEWAISPDLAHVLICTVLANRPKCIVECGSGTSTLLMAYCLKQIGEGVIWSLEHEEKYARTTRKNLKAHGMEDQARVVHAPLQQVLLNGKSWLWYETTFLDKLDPIDLLFIDGPPARLGHMMRYPALPLIHQRLSKHAVIILDDAGRKDERQIVEVWLKEFTDFEYEWLDTQKGTVVLRRVISGYPD